MNRFGGSRVFTLSALFAAMIPAMQAQAGGFQLQEHSAVGVGRAFSGEAAQIDHGAAVVASNPAAMSRIDQRTLTVHGTYLMPSTDVKGTASGIDGVSRQKDVVPNKLIPSGFVVFPVNEQWTIGFGGFSNFGLPTEYEPESGISLLGSKTEVITANFNASASYAFSDSLSLGFGINAIYGEAELAGVMPSDSPLFPGQTAMSLEGDGWGHGWNVGLLWQATERTRVGLTYRSEVDITFRGGATSDIMDGVWPLPQWNASGKVDFTLPEIAEIAIHHQLTNTIAVHASAMYTGWRTMDTIVLDIDNGDSVPEFPQGWSGSNRYSIGATWDYNDQWTFRTGVLKDETPTPNSHRSVRIPDGNKTLYSLGASYKINSEHSVDFAYSHATGGKVKITDEMDFPLELPGSSFEGTAEGSAHFVSVQYNYRF